MGSVINIFRLNRKEPKCHNCTRILQSRSYSRADPKTFRNRKSSADTARLRLAEQNTSQENVLRRNLSAVYPGIGERTYQLTYCQKFQNF